MQTVPGTMVDNATLGRVNMDASAAIPAGVVLPYAGNTGPSGWCICDGRTLSRTGNADLFAAIGTVYGVGDGSTTFNVPDLRGRVPAGRDGMGIMGAANRLTTAGSGVDGATLGAAGGGQNHVLTEAQMPLHGHPYRLDASAGVASQTNGGILISTAGAGLVTRPAFTGAPSDTNSETIGGTGGGTAHPNVQPTIVLGYIIKL